MLSVLCAVYLSIVSLVSLRFSPLTAGQSLDASERPAIAQATAERICRPVDTLTVDQVIGRYIEALGGRESIERLQTRILTGRMITDLPTWKPPVYENYPIVVHAKPPGKSLRTHYKPGGIVTEGTNGVLSWKRDDGGVSQRDRRFPSRLDWLFDPQGAFRTKTHFPNLELKGIETINGKECFVLQPAGMDKAYTALYFDIETGLLVQTGYYRRIEFREVDGVMVPWRISMSRKGGSTKIIIDEVVHNIPIDDGLFAMPSSGSPPEGKEYRHPKLGTRFTATGNWRAIRHPEDDLIYEVVDPDNILHVMLWYTSTEMDCSAYLKKMAGMKGLISKGEPEKRVIGEREAWTLKALNGSGVSNAAGKATLLFYLAAFRDGDGLHIARVWCPEALYFQRIIQIEEIISSLGIDPRE
jgi:hypothetical protein